MEELRKKRMAELMARQGQQHVQEQFQQQIREEEIERQIKHIMTQILDSEARQRISNLRLAKPDFARQIEVLLIQLHQAGRLPKRLSDPELKKILSEISAKKRDTKITR